MGEGASWSWFQAASGVPQTLRFCAQMTRACFQGLRNRFSRSVLPERAVWPVYAPRPEVWPREVMEGWGSEGNGAGGGPRRCPQACVQGHSGFKVGLPWEGKAMLGGSLLSLNPGLRLCPEEAGVGSDKEVLYLG